MTTPRRADGGRAASAPSSMPLAERAGGPDLARGLAILGIGLANIVGWLHGRPWTVLLKQADAAPVDRTVDVLLAVLVDNRGFPLFALLLGYGIGVMHRRSREAGERTGRFLLRMLRRFAVLALIGMAHAVLLFSGDILVAYAVIGMLCALLVTRGRIALPVAGAVSIPALAVFGWSDALIALGGGDGYAAAGAGTAAEALVLRGESALTGLLTAPVVEIGLMAPMALGAIAARIRLLETARRQGDMLRPLARWGIGTGVLGALPLALVLLLDPHLQVVTSQVLLGTLGVVHQLSGLIGAVGCAAAAALLAERASTSPLLRSITALGAMSLTCYIAQSLVMAALMPPYMLDLGARLGSAGAAAIVLALWLALLPLASALRRHARRGPLEHLLRRLAGSASPARAALPHAAQEAS